MSSRLARLARAAVAEVRSTLSARGRSLFALILAAGDLGFRLPTNVNLREVSGDRDPRRRLEPLLRRMQRDGGPWTAERDRLVRRIVDVLRRRGDRDGRPLRVLVAYAGGALSPDGLPPADPILAAAFGAVVRVFPRLYRGAVRPLGRLSFVSAADLERLLRETRSNVRRGRKSSGRRPGLRGRELAVDPRLMARVGRALGRAVTPGYEARYIFYAKPGDFFWPHPDDPKYSANLLLCLERTPPSDGGRPSAFFAYPAKGARRRVDLRPGQALVAEARGILHGREPLRRGEKVTLLSIELKFRR